MVINFKNLETDFHAYYYFKLGLSTLYLVAEKKTFKEIMNFYCITEMTTPHIRKPAKKSLFD